MYYLYLLGNLITTVFPRSVSYSIAKFFATIHFYLATKERQAVIYNLTPLIKDKSELYKSAKNVFINFAYYLTDFFSYKKIDHDFIKKYVKIKGLENLQLIFSQKKQAIALTAHIGNYELAANATSLLGYPVAAVALAHKDKRVDNFFNKRRLHFGAQVIPTGSRIKGCLKALKKRNLLALLGDREFSGQGIKLKMLGRWAIFPRGAAFFALKTGACIIPAFLVRKNKYYYQLTFEEAINCENSTQLKEEDIVKNYIVILEKYLKMYPDQWYLFEKYWLDENGNKH